MMAHRYTPSKTYNVTLSHRPHELLSRTCTEIQNIAFNPCFPEKILNEL